MRRDVRGKRIVGFKVLISFLFLGSLAEKHIDLNSGHLRRGEERRDVFFQMPSETQIRWPFS